MSDEPFSGDSDAALRRAVERFATLLAEAGVPRMAARVWAFFVIDETNRATAGELADRLQVSPAAISGAVRYLVQAGMLVREREPGARSDHYRLHDDLWYETYLHRLVALQEWDAVLSEAVEAVGEDRIGASLRETQAFLSFMTAEFPALLERWREHKARTLGRRPQPRRA